MSKKRVLVVGGSGYLGQHLLQGFSEIQGSPFDLAFTHHSTPPHPLISAIPHSRAFHVNLQSGEGFQTISHSFGQVRLGYQLKIMDLIIFSLFFFNQILLSFELWASID